MATYNVASPRLNDLDTDIEALFEAVRTLEESDWIKAVPGSAEGAIKFNRRAPPVVRADVAEGAAVALTNNGLANVATIVLPPGLWRVLGQVNYVGTGGPTFTQAAQGAHTVSATLPDKSARSLFRWGAVIVGDPGFPITPRLLDFTTATGNTTVYLVAQASFSGGTGLGAYGWIEAEKIAV